MKVNWLRMRSANAELAYSMSIIEQTENRALPPTSQLPGGDAISK